MKKNILFLAFLAIALSSLFFFIQCHKGCESKYLGELKFSPTDLAIVPYNGTEHLIFRDSLGDSICYDSTSIRSSQYYYRINDFSNDKCPGNFYNCELNYTDFVGYNYFTNISTDVHFNPFSTNMKKYIYISICYLKTQKWYFEGYFNFDNLKLYDITVSDIYTSGALAPFASISSFNDSLIVGPRKFYDVYKLKQIIKPDKIGNIQFVYYTISNGIVGFKTEEGHMWYLSL